MNKILPLYKSHYSFKSILTLEPVKKNLKEYPISIFNLVLDSKQDFLCLVEDNMTSFLQASDGCEKNKLKLIYGLRLEFTNDVSKQDEASLKKRAKYIIFAKNIQGYKLLIKIWSFAAKNGFYYNACMDFENLKRFWTDDLILMVPFYDSFLHLNSLEGHFHVPNFELFKPIFLLEDNEIPFDSLLRNKAINFASSNGFETLESQSIFYKSPDDFIAFTTYKCSQNRTNVEKPELNHFCSDTFNYERWKQRNE